jgi:hypothetical protein
MQRMFANAVFWQVSRSLLILRTGLLGLTAVR